MSITDGGSFDPNYSFTCTLEASILYWHHHTLKWLISGSRTKKRAEAHRVVLLQLFYFFIYGLAYANIL